MSRKCCIPAMLACLALLVSSPIFAQGAFVEQGGLVVVEVESVSPATGWVSETAQTGFTGTSYYKWMGGDKLSSPGSGILEYKIKINNPGVYRFEWHNKVGNGSSTTDFNDTWLKIPDATDFYAQDGGSSIKHPHGDCTNDCPAGAGSGGWFKVFSSGTTAWTWSSHTNDGGANYFIYARFDAAGIYTVQISGRSDHHCIDRFVLYKVGVAVNPTSLTQPQSTREGTVQPTSIIMKAIEFTNISAGAVPFYIDGQRLAINAANTTYRDKWAAATAAFPGTTGTYNVTVSSMYEGDGESKYALKIGADSLGAFQCPSAWTGTSQTIADYTIYRHTFSGVSVAQNAVVKVYGMCNSNGNVPETGGFAWSRGRWTQVEFVPTGVTTTIVRALAGSVPTRLHLARNLLTLTAAQSGMHTLRICSLDGRSVFTSQTHIANGGTAIIPLNGRIGRGTYVAHVETKGVSKQRQVIVLR